MIRLWHACDFDGNNLSIVIGPCGADDALATLRLLCGTDCYLD